MIEIVLVLLAVWLVVWYVRFTVRTFATVCRCLWQAALAVGTIARILCAWWPRRLSRPAWRVLERAAPLDTDRNLARPASPWPLTGANLR